MKELKTKSVAILYKSNGSCEYVLSCTHITDTEYKTLIGEMLENKRQANTEKKELKEHIESLEKELETIKREIALLKGEEQNEETSEECN